jgi:hypothetical protein
MHCAQQAYEICKKIVGKLKRQRVYLKDPSVDGRIILKRNLNYSGVRL